jgi:16S rRNA (guanine527-N7)-methyltransferase
MVGQHVLDSLAVLPWLTFDTLADIGSGGGLPGIPLAIARPEGRVALVESNQKKFAFLQQAKIELGLANVDVVQTRAEGWQPEPLFDTVTSRAFSDLAEFLRLTSHLLAPGGVFAAMKGVHPYEEIAQIPAGFAVEKVIPLTVPQVEGVRHLVLIRKTP